MTRITILIIFFSLQFKIYSQKNRNFLIPTVIVPQKLNWELVINTYNPKIHKDLNKNSSVFINNLENFYDLKFKNGIYTFKGNGPHFPKRIFIYDNRKYYIFKSIAAFDSLGLTNEFETATFSLKIKIKKKSKYKILILKFLSEECGKTYGGEKVKSEKLKNQ